MEYLEADSYKTKLVPMLLPLGGVGRRVGLEGSGLRLEIRQAVKDESRLIPYHHNPREA